MVTDRTTSTVVALPTRIGAAESDVSWELHHERTQAMVPRSDSALPVTPGLVLCAYIWETMEDGYERIPRNHSVQTRAVSFRRSGRPTCWLPRGRTIRHVCLGRGGRSRGSSAEEDGKVSSGDSLEDLYTQQEDPWRYATDPYELGKYAATLAALTRDRYPTGLEIGCSEGVFTQQAAARVDRLLGIDVSATAIDRARRRCAALPHVEFRRIDFIRDDLSERFDVVFCSEVLYYIPPWKRTEVARKIASWLKPDGHLVLVHTWQESTREWDDVYGEGGAEHLHRLFSHVLGLPVVYEYPYDDYEVKIVRAAPAVYPAWRRHTERMRLGLRALFPTARMIGRNRLRRMGGIQRLVGTDDKHRRNAKEPTETDG